MKTMSREITEESPKRRKLKNILILGPKLSSAAFLGEKYKDEDSLFIYCDSKTSEADLIKTITDAGEIEERAQINIFAHGNTREGSHEINLLEGNPSTKRLFSVLDEISGHKPLNLNLYSCFGGAAAKDIDSLPNGSTCVCHSPEDDSIYSLNVVARLSLAKDGTGNVLEDLIKGSWAEHHTITLATKLKDGTAKKVTLRQPKNPIIKPEEISRFISGQWSEAITEEFGSADPSLLPDNFRLSDIPPRERIEEIFTLHSDTYSVASLCTHAYEGETKMAEDMLREYLALKKAEDPEKLAEILHHRTHPTYDTYLNVASTYNIELSTILLNAGAKYTDHDTTDAIIALSKAFASGNKEFIEAFLNSRSKDQVEIDVDGLPPILRAATSSDLPELRRLVSLGADINALDENGMTPLHHAVSRGNINAIVALIESGADLNALDKNEQNPLYLAVSNGNKDMVNLLASLGADVNARDNDNKSPIHFAAANGDASMIRFLRDQGVDLNAMDINMNTPIHYAAQQRNSGALKELLKNSRPFLGRNVKGFTPLQYAAENMNIDGAKLLIKNRLGFQPVDKEVAANLIEFALFKEDYESVEIFSKAGARFNKEPAPEMSNLINDIIKDAIAEGNRERLNLMLKAGADLNALDENRNTYLIRACFSGNPDIVRDILAQNPDVNATNIFGASALHYSTLSEDTSVLSALLETPGVRLDIKDTGGKTALDHAVENGLKDHAKLLLSKELSIKAPEKFSALDLAIISGRDDIASKFLPYGYYDIESVKKDYVPYILSDLIETGDFEHAQKLYRSVSPDVQSCCNKYLTEQLYKKPFEEKTELEVKTEAKSIEIIIESGVDIYSKDSNGRSIMSSLVDFSTSEIESVRLASESAKSALKPTDKLALSALTALNCRIEKREEALDKFKSDCDLLLGGDDRKKTLKQLGSILKDVKDSSDKKTWQDLYQVLATTFIASERSKTREMVEKSATSHSSAALRESLTKQSPANSSRVVSIKTETPSRSI